MNEDQTVDVVTLATELTIAWLGNPNTRVQSEEVPAFLKSMFDAVAGLNSTPAPEAQASPEMPQYVAAVTSRKSLASPDHILSMIDGKPYKTLRRHLSGHGLTPEDYRARYGLKDDYPMVAPAYSAERRAMAKKIGLGRKPGQKPAAKAAPVAPQPDKAPARGRGRKAATAPA